MKSAIATVTSKGQVTIPAEIRAHLGVEQGDKLIFEVEESGTVTVRATAYPTIESLRGMAGTLDRPLAWDEMRRIARDDALRSKASPR